MLEDVQANRNYKASVFSTLFSEPQVTLELYNAVTGQNYPPDTKIEIVTLSDALFKGQLNDVAFVVDGKQRQHTAEDVRVYGQGIRENDKRQGFVQGKK